MLFILYGNVALGDSNFHQMITTSLGMVNVSVTENASSLSSASSSTSTTTTDSNVSTPSSVSASVISLDLVYEFSHFNQKSYFIRATAPMLSSDGSGFFAGSIGMNFYFSSLASLYSFNDNGSTLSINPTMRFYWGTNAGVGFLVYNTTTAKKSDLIFDLELHGGGIMNFKKEWGLRGEAGLSRGTGVSTSTIAMKIFIGLSYYLEK